MKTSGIGDVVSTLLFQFPELVFKVLEFVRRTELIGHSILEFLPRQGHGHLDTTCILLFIPPRESSFLEHTRRKTRLFIIRALGMKESALHTLEPLEQSSCPFGTIKGWRFSSLEGFKGAGILGSKVSVHVLLELVHHVWKHGRHRPGDTRSESAIGSALKVRARSHSAGIRNT